MFSRQWFSAQSQTGLTREALFFEQLLRHQKFKAAYQVLTQLSDDSTPYWRRQYKRLMHLVALHKSWNISGINTVRVFFDCFWPDMNSSDCQLLDILKFARQDLVFETVYSPDECDLAFYSCYGHPVSLMNSEHASRLLFLGENVRPFYSDYDFSITTDTPTYCGRNAYLPLALLEIDWFQKSYKDRHTISLTEFTVNTFVDLHTRINKIAYVGNNCEPFRISLIHNLSEAGFQIDTYGSHTNPVVNKSQLLSKYKVTLAMENSLHHGYFTEKLPQAYYGCPYVIYWGYRPPEFVNANPSNILHVSTTMPLDNIASFVSNAFCNNTSFLKPSLFNASSTRECINTMFHAVASFLKVF